MSGIFISYRRDDSAAIARRLYERLQFLDRTLNEAWAELSLDSPNHGRLRHELTAHRFEPGAASVRWLVRRLCEAGA